MSADEQVGTGGISRIDRVVDLGVDRETLWQLISTEDGWRDWLVDEARLVDGAGVVRDGGVVRHVRIDGVQADRSIGFTWWEHGDPASVSHVTLEIVDDDDVDGATGVAGSGRDGGAHVTRLRIAEQLLAGVVAPEARVAWEVRVCSLWACTVAMALV